MQRLQRTLSMLMVLGMLLTAVSPAAAQEQWPAGKDAATPSVSVPVRVPQVGQGPVAVPVQEPDGVAPTLPKELTTVPRNMVVGDPFTDPEVAARRFGDALVRTVIHLEKPALAQVGATLSPEARVAYAAEVAALQDRLTAQIEGNGGQVLVRFRTLSSGMVALLPPRQIAIVASLPEVARIGTIQDYEMDLSETVPHVGGSYLHNLGITGEGINVAVLDSGIDFTHLAFGGPGTDASFESAYFGSNAACTEGTENVCANQQFANPAYFGPNAPKVKGGYDWLGEAWPDADMAPDPNPIDVQGHGTHVGDIIAGFGYNAGTNEDGDYPAKGVGMAPGANLWAFKVCASFSPSCNGVALLAAMDDAADLDNNPATYDPADVVNLSLGSLYGQPEDDLTYFVNQSVAYGSIVVASAGNSADKPYIVGSPSMADGAISVAQTTVPSDKQYLPEILSPASISGTLNSAIFQTWSVSPEARGQVTGTVAYGNEDGSNKNGCAAYTSDMTGKVLLMDRGSCAFTQKAKNASAAGAVLAFIGLIAPGEPFTGGDSGDRPIDISVFMISQAESNKIKSGLAQGVTITLDPDKFIGLIDTMVGSSSRGPRNHDSVIKPDIGAPGGSISAIAGSGSAIGPFGGTSGAAPMVSGAAALLKGFFGDQFTVQQYKALLMNTANNVLYVDGAVSNGGGGTLAPITRIGGGQLDVKTAQATRLLAWDSTEAEDDPLKRTGSLSFGYVPVVDTYAATRTLTIQNLGPLNQPVSIESYFRYSSDVGQGVFVTPLKRSVTVPAGGTVDVPVRLDIFNGGLSGFTGPLKEWVLNKGSLGASGAALTYQEYDGYIYISTGGGAEISVPWQVLPKKVADVQLANGMAASTRAMPGSGALVNASSIYTGYTDAFALVDLNPNDYNYLVGECSSVNEVPGCNLSPVDLKEVGVRNYNLANVGQILEFGVTVWDFPYRAGQFPNTFDIYIDNNQDGEADFVVYNYDIAGGSDGRNVVFVDNLALQNTPENRDPSIFFFTDSSLNTQNWILPVPAAAVGLSLGQTFDFVVYAFDGYFGGGVWDCSPRVGNFCAGVHTYTLGQPRFDLGENQLFLTTAPEKTTAFEWTSTPNGDKASPSQIGLLFMHAYAPVGRESDFLYLASSYVTATNISVTAEPMVALPGTPVTVTAVVTDELGGLDSHTVWFSDGNFRAELSGQNEVPKPVTTTATGLATFKVDFATGVTTYTLDASNIVSPTAAHIHVGKAGVNGGVIHHLYDATGAKAPSSLPATGVITLTHNQIQSLLQDGLYVNLHTSGNPAGEIRGQITGAKTAYTDMNGEASSVWTDDTPGTLTIYALTGNIMDSVDITFTDVTALSLSAEPTTINIHEALTVTAMISSSGKAMAGGKLFVTDGALHAILSGANEVPTNTSTATGMAEFEVDLSGLNENSTTVPVSYVLTVNGIDDFSAAHVHVGKAGVNGGVLHPLTLGTGTFNLAVSNLPTFLNEGLYVNVHTTSFPAGELRGQITGAVMATADSNGKAVTQFTPNYFGDVTIYGIAMSVPTVKGSVDVTVIPMKLYAPLINKN